MKKIVILIGDPNSINSEILYKTWKTLSKKIRKNVYFISNYELIKKQFKILGFKTKILEFKDKNSYPVKNLYARLGNTSPNFCYAGHLDVVPPGNLNDWIINPFKPAVKKGYLIGRGANDMKSSIAAFVTAVNDFSKKNKKFVKSYH